MHPVVDLGSGSWFGAEKRGRGGQPSVGSAFPSSALPRTTGAKNTKPPPLSLSLSLSYTHTHARARSGAVFYTTRSKGELPSGRRGQLNLVHKYEPRYEAS